MTDPYEFDPDQTIGPDDILPTEPRTVAQVIGDDATGKNDVYFATPLTGTSPEAETLIAADRGDLVPKNAAPGDTSDGFHTFDELYEHRRALMTVLATIGSINGDSWRSSAHHPDDSPIFDGYFIVGIELPQGPITYHYPAAQWDLFSAVPVLDHAPKWDGATPADTIVRLDDFAVVLKQAIDDGHAVQEQAHQAADKVVAEMQDEVKDA